MIPVLHYYWVSIIGEQVRRTIWFNQSIHDGCKMHIFKKYRTGDKDLVKIVGRCLLTISYLHKVCYILYEAYFSSTGSVTVLYKVGRVRTSFCTFTRSLFYRAQL